MTTFVLHVINMMFVLCNELVPVCCDCSFIIINPPVSEELLVFVLCDYVLLFLLLLLFQNLLLHSR